jgi:DNA-directed RNA polymerase specialized sigma24 family protein
MASPDSEKQLAAAEWEAVLRHCEKVVRRRLARMGFAEETIEEALLSTVLKMVEKQAAGSEILRESMLGLCWTTAYHCAIDLARKPRRESPLEDADGETDHPTGFISPGPSSERPAIVKIDVNRCLDRLPATERAIVLHRSFGLTAREIRDLLGIKSEASVNTRYCQACKFLRQCLAAYTLAGGRRVADAAR